MPDNVLFRQWDIHHQKGVADTPLRLKSAKNAKMSGKAENQANVNLSYKKFYAIRKIINKTFAEKFYYDMQMEIVSKILKFGDTQPAVVVSTNPLLIAAYSDEMDAVIMLKFPTELAAQYDLAAGSRLTTSNSYLKGDKCADDIFPGTEFSCNYADFTPIVQLFIGKKDEKIKGKVDLFDASTWEKVKCKADEYTTAHPELCRDGFFYFKKNR